MHGLILTYFYKRNLIQAYLFNWNGPSAIIIYIWLTQILILLTRKSTFLNKNRKLFFALN